MAACGRTGIQRLSNLGLAVHVCIDAGRAGSGASMPANRELYRRQIEATDEEINACTGVSPISID